MDKDIYKEIIAEVSEKLASKIMAEEKDLAKRATLIDMDIAELVREVGLQATQRVLESVRDKIVIKKKKKG